MSDMTSNPIVFIVDDDPDMRGALRYLIEGIGLEIREYENGRAFLNDYDGSRPACLVLDMRMPDIGGLEVQEDLLSRGIDIPVILLTGFGDVPSAVRALKSGALDFIEKPFSNQELLDKIQRGLEKDVQRQQDRELRAELQNRVESLTPRESEVMVMVTSGNSNKEISRTLDISIKTVESHRAQVMDKMQTANIAELMNLLHQNQGKPLNS